MENSITSLPQQTAMAQPADNTDPLYASYFDYTKVKPRLDRLIGDWWYYRNKAIESRNARYIRLNPEELRQKGVIQQNQTMIPCRIIDNNVIREKADAMNFLNSANRLAYFRCVDDPNEDTRQLESDFTKGLTYPDWYLDFDRHYDGACLHGWDSMEITYDETKPLHVAITHIGYDKLIYNPRVRDIQDSSYLLLQSEVTSLELETMIQENGFDQEQVNRLTIPGKETRNDDKVFCVYKVYFKYQRYVYTAWYSKETGCNDWLRAPEFTRLGLLMPMPQISSPQGIGANVLPMMQDQTQPPIPDNCIPSEILGYMECKVIRYPVERYTYLEDEQLCINDKVGRAFLDNPQQEATTAITSGYVNGIIAASDIYATWKTDIDENDKLEEVELAPGRILPPIEFFHQPYPDSSVLSSLQYLDALNSRQTGKMATAVSNRQDSRKTAKELSLAESEQNKISSTSLATYNNFIRNLYNSVWAIVKCQALANQIKFLLTPQTNIDDLGNQQVTLVNDIEKISKTYDIRAAGEIDVIQKAEQMQAMQQDWPVLQNTALAQSFLEDYIRLRYPMKADQYVAVLKAGDPGKQVAQSLLSALTGLAQQDEGKLNPQQRDQLSQVIQSAMMYLNPQAAQQHLQMADKQTEKDNNENNSSIS